NPGENGPYQQSERLHIYKEHIATLLEKDMAYHCFCSSERLTELREEQTSLKLPTKYDKTCRFLSTEEVGEKLAKGASHTIRLKVPENKEISFRDTIKGKIEFNSKDVDDQVLMKSDGFPTYHFAVVVDDYLMGVTDIIRGDEWIPSTPKHILLYDAFEWTKPNFTHIPPLIGANKKKLSKRDGDVAVEIFLEKGYLTEAIINYIALLGWNPKTTEEFFTMSELIEKFDLAQVHKAGAFFDIERLEFFNGHYIKNTPIDDLYNKLLTFLRRYYPECAEKISGFDEAYNKKILSELSTKMKKFSEFEELTKFFYSDDISVDNEILLNAKMKVPDIDAAKAALRVSLTILEKQSGDFESVEAVKQVFIEGIKAADMKNGQVLWPARVATSGEQFSPGALEMIYILGVEKSRQRMDKLLNQL
ncbi:glutamate--tRNA ligase, partial [Candidatus Gracilibacteria bacterium]|nr:glutamate--tRNA ligase [Candidatus Gracilibacteria bacterium]